MFMKKNMLADERKQKYIVPANFGFIMSGFCIVSDWRRSQAKMTLIELSCKYRHILEYFLGFLRRSIMSKMVCFLFL